MLEVRTFAVGGRVLAVRCAGALHWSQLRRALLPAQGAPDLTLELWDPDETGDPGLATGGGASLRFESPAFDVLLDRSAGRATGWVRAARVEPWQALRPWQALLVWALADMGAETVHASMVARDGAGVLLPAPNAHGKSTTALACLAAGMDCLGDDAVSVEPNGAGPLGHTLHAVAKLSTAGLAAFPGLYAASERYEDPAEDERAVRLAELEPVRAVPTARVAAIAFPRLAPGGRSAATAMRPSRAASELLRNTLSVSSERLADVFGTMTALASAVPAYTLEVGTDPAGVAEAVESLVA
jgi:hypothetical protein